MCSVKLFAWAGQLGYDIVLRIIFINPVDNVKKKRNCIHKKLNKNAYNDLILAQYIKVCFQIIEELVDEDFTNGIALHTQERLNKTFQIMAGSHKRRLCNKFSKI